MIFWPYKRLKLWGVRSAQIMGFPVSIIYSPFLLSTSSVSPSPPPPNPPALRSWHLLLGTIQHEKMHRAKQYAWRKRSSMTELMHLLFQTTCSIHHSYWPEPHRCCKNSLSVYFSSLLTSDVCRPWARNGNWLYMIFVWDMVRQLSSIILDSDVLVRYHYYWGCSQGLTQESNPYSMVSA